MGTIVAGVLLGVATSLVAAEIFELLPRLAVLLIKFAARGLPSDMRVRYREEWLAEVNHIPGRLTKVVWALDLLRASFVLRNTRPFGRTFELVFSVFCLVIFVPIFAIIAVLLKFELGRGPVLFRQGRIGPDGRVFVTWQFRTLATDSDTPTLGPVGRFLRRQSLDQLPLLLNVLRGEMTLVAGLEIKAAISRELQNLFRLVRRWTRR